ncbi:MAG: T9SS type A sorting domain-containing protein [Bacteroidales bacterium]|nr:T9SS type A sorting domain-containing protein [Bacteroidales bacterium]
MKRKIFSTALLALLLLCSGVARGQEAVTNNPSKNEKTSYLPVFPDSTLTFNIAFSITMKEDHDPWFLGAMSYRYIGDEEDTVVYNNQRYRRFGEYEGQPGWMCVREETETGRIFRYYPELDTEVVVSDMSLMEGDTFILPIASRLQNTDYCYAEYNEQPYIIVDSVKYVNGRKVIRFQPHPESLFFSMDIYNEGRKYPLLFIEGVGPSYGPFGKVDQSGLESWLGLFLCVHHGDSLYYMTDPKLGCEQYVSSVAEYSKVAMQVYPNPTDNVLHVSVTDSEIARVEMYDAYGRNVSVETHGRASLPSPKTTVNTSALPPGMYILRVTLRDGAVRTEKIVKR